MIAPNRLLWLDKAKRETESGKQEEKNDIKKIEAAPSTLLQRLRHRVCALRLGPIKVDYGNCCGLPCSQNAARQLIFLTGNELLLLQFNPNSPSEQKWSSLHTISLVKGLPLFISQVICPLWYPMEVQIVGSKKVKKRGFMGVLCCRLWVLFFFFCPSLSHLTAHTSSLITIFSYNYHLRQREMTGGLSYPRLQLFALASHWGTWLVSLLGCKASYTHILMSHNCHSLLERRITMTGHDARLPWCVRKFHFFDNYNNLEHNRCTLRGTTEG